MAGWKCGSRVGVEATQPLSWSSIGSVINDVKSSGEQRGDGRSWMIHRGQGHVQKEYHCVGWAFDAYGC